MPGDQPSVESPRASLPVSVTDRVTLADSSSTQTDRPAGDDDSAKTFRKNREFLLPV
jgi:hypothetical protein